MSGKTLRLEQLFASGRRLFAVPMDHGTSIGPVPGLQDPAAMARQVCDGGADAVIVHKGQARRIAQAGIPNCILIVHLSASTDLAPDPNSKQMVSTTEHAIRLGATAVSVHVNLGSQDEKEMLRDLGRTAEQCDMWGIPLLAMMYVRDGDRQSEHNPVKVAHAARVAEELGADIVKVNYTGTIESFAGVVAGVKIPVVIAGGPKSDSLRDLLYTVRDATSAGARGVALGRNVFQAPHPADTARLVRCVLDDDAVDINNLIAQYGGASA